MSEGGTFKVLPGVVMQNQALPDEINASNFSVRQSRRKVLHNYSARDGQPRECRWIPSRGTDIFLPKTSKPAVLHIQ